VISDGFMYLNNIYDTIFLGQTNRSSKQLPRHLDNFRLSAGTNDHKSEETTLSKTSSNLKTGSYELSDL